VVNLISGCVFIHVAMMAGPSSRGDASDQTSEKGSSLGSVTCLKFQTEESWSFSLVWQFHDNILQQLLMHSYTKEQISGFVSAHSKMTMRPINNSEADVDMRDVKMRSTWRLDERYIGAIPTFLFRYSSNSQRFSSRQAFQLYNCQMG
jgi:hypothetical protein